MVNLIHVSDAIQFKSINTGGQSVGNGGDGNSSGNIVNQPTIHFDPSNTATGGSVHTTTGDHVGQSADWDAGGSNTTAAVLSTAIGGSASSNGNQSSDSGHDTTVVSANTTAYQTNSLVADMHQDAFAGIGGNGGSGDAALGGDVNVDLPTVI